MGVCDIFNGKFTLVLRLRSIVAACTFHPLGGTTVALLGTTQSDNLLAAYRTTIVFPICFILKEDCKSFITRDDSIKIRILTEEWGDDDPRCEFPKRSI